MSNLISAKMIVLRKTKYSESDLIIQGLQENGVKISLLARGALNSKKRFNGGVLEPTHQILVQYQEPRNQHGLAVLSEAVLLRDFAKLRSSYERIETALQIVEWMNHVSLEAGEDLHAIYHLLGHALAALELTENFENFKVHFLIRFLNQQGILDVEKWMEPFLKTPMAKTGEIHWQSADRKQSLYLTEKLNHYMGLKKC